MNESKKYPQIRYFDSEDVLYIVFSDDEEAGSYEISPNITVELNENGEIIGVEILNATAFLRDWLIEGLQARLALQRASQA